MATQLASAYVQIIPSMKGAIKTIETQLSGVNTNTVGQKIGQNIGSGISSNIKTAATSAVGAIGSIGGAIGQLAATGGFARALNVKKAQQMFQGMKLEYEDYKDTIMESVDGTAFAFDQAALVSASLAASGVAAGDDMSKALHACTGVAATFGSDLGDIGTIFGKIAATGKVQSDELNQLAERGVPAFQILSEQLGVTTEDVRQMVKDGKVNFQMFSDAMYNAFGDSAAAANDSFSGSFANLKSALNKIGEKFANPIIENAVPIFNALREAINAVKDTIDPVVEKFSDFLSVFSGGLIERIDWFAETIRNGGGILAAFQSALGGVAGTIAAVLSVFGVIGAIGGALSALVGSIPVVGSLIGAFAGGSGALAAFGAAVSLIISPLGALIGVIGVAAAALWQVDDFAEAVMDTFAASKSYIEEGMSPIENFGRVVGRIFDAAKENAGPALDVIKSTVSNLVTSLKGSLPDLKGYGAEVKKALSHINIGDTNLAEIFDQVADSFKSSFERIKTQVEPFIAALAPIKDGIGGLVDNVKDKLESMGVVGGNLEAHFGGVVGVFKFLTGAFSPMAAIASGVAGAFANLTNTNDNFRASVLAVINQFAQGFSPTLNLIGSSIVPMFSAVIESNKSIMATWQTTLSSIIQSVFPAFISIISSVVPVFGQIIATVAQVVTAFTPFVTSIYSQLIPAFGQIITTVAQIIAQVTSQAMPIISQVVAAIGGILTATAPLIAQLASSLIPVIGQVIGVLAQCAGQITSALLPVISQVVGAIIEVANAVIPVVISAIEQVAPVLGDIIMVIAQLIAAIAPLIAQLVSTLIPIVTQVITLVVDCASRIIAAVMPAIQQIVAAIQENMPTIQSIIEQVSSTIQSVIETAWPVVESVITSVCETVASFMEETWPMIAEIIGTAMTNIMTFMDENWPAIQEVIETVMEVVSNVIETVWPAIETTIGTVLDGIQAVITAVMQAINGDWEGAWNTISDFLGGVWEDICSGVEGGINDVLDWFGGLPDKILGALGDLGNLLVDAGKSIIDGLLKGLSDFGSGIAEWGGSIIDNIIACKGPPEYDEVMLIPAGKAIMNSLLIGLESGEQSVFKHLRSFTSDLGQWEFGEFDRGFEFKASRSLTYQPILDNQNQTDAPLVINGNVTLDASKFKNEKDLDQFRKRLYKELKMAKAGA